MANFSLYLPDDVKAKLDELVKKTGTSRNELIRRAIDDYLKR